MYLAQNPAQGYLEKQAQSLILRTEDHTLLIFNDTLANILTVLPTGQAAEGIFIVFLR